MGSRTRGSRRPDVRQGLGYHMERKRGAFKVKLSAASIRCLFDDIASSRPAFLVP
jgi:hypothetical protein